MSTGLILGKFAPLHRGHQRLIEIALQENDRVIVMPYHAPDVTTIPLPVRAGWIRQCFPQVEILEAWDGPLETGDTQEIKQMHEHYLPRRLDGRKVDRFYSSEFYGEHVSQALNAIDRRIDPERMEIPISASAIRKDPYAHREFLEPFVYRDLIIQVVFLGAPSTGKTSLARALAEQHQTVWMPEYGLEYWLQHQQDRRLSLEQLLELAEGHIEREEQLIQQANRYLFIDTDATTTAMFSRYYHNRVHPELATLADACRERYDLFFLCSDDIAYEETWDRSGDTFRTVFQQQTEADLRQRKIPFISLSGPLEKRLERVNRALTGFRKFQSLGDHLLR